MKIKNFSILLFILFSTVSNIYAFEKPEIFIQNVAFNFIETRSFSSDGKYLSIGGDNKFVLYETFTGREIRTFMDNDGITAIAVSSDGKFILSGNEAGFIKLWDVMSGKVIKSLPTGKKVRIIRFSRDDTLAISHHDDSQLMISDIKIGQVLKKIGYGVYVNGYLENGDKGEIYALIDRELEVAEEFSGGKKINVPLPPEEQYKNVYSLVDLTTDKELQIVKFKSRFESGKLGKFSFSKDGNYALFQQGKKIYLINFSNGDEISSWSVPDEFEYSQWLIISRDGKLAITAGSKGIFLWDAFKGEKLKVLTDKEPYFICLSPDGKYLLSGRTFHLPELWDVSSGKKILSYSNSNAPVSGITLESWMNKNYSLLNRGNLPPMIFDWSSITPKKIFESYSEVYTVGTSGNYILLVDKNKQGTLWVLKENKAKHFDNNNMFLALSEDEKYAVTLTLPDKEEIKVWDMVTDKKIFRHSERWSKQLRAAFSYDNRYLIINSDYNIKVIDLSTGKVKFSYSAPPSDYRDILGIKDFAISRNNRYLAVTYLDKDISVLKIWDINSGKEVNSIIEDRIRKIELLPDGRTFVLSGYRKSKDYEGDIIVLIDSATGFNKGELKSGFRCGGAWKTDFSDDGNLIVAGSCNRLIFWDPVTNKIKKYTDLSHGISEVKLIDNTRIALKLGDQTIRLLNLDTLNELARLYAFTDGEWIVITPEGYFNASPNGAKHLNVRVGNKVYSIDNFYEKFFNPVYVASVLQGKKVEAVADIRKGILTPPDVRIISPEPNKEFTTDTITITVSAKDTGGGIDEIRLYHNGKAVGEDTRAVKIVPKGNEIIKNYTVTLLDGINTFRATAFSKDRIESNPYELIVRLTAPQKEVSFYVLAIGINRYKNPALNLNYAEPDARAIAEFFRQKGSGLFKAVKTIELYNEEATKAIIISKLKQLENTNPQDAVLIYLAGHGENISDKWYFIPYELTYPEREGDIRTKGLSSDELSGLIKNIKAQKILVLIDACKAGAVLVAFRGFEDRKAFSQLSRATGVHVIAASTKDQFAAEVKELGHGVFTYTLLEGLKGKARVVGGEAVTVFGLKSYLEASLPEISKKYKTEAQYPIGTSSPDARDFPLVIVK